MVNANTLRTYRLHWRKWQSWAKAREVPELPVNHQDLADFLLHLADSGASLSAIRLVRAAVVAMHRAKDLPDPTARKIVRQTMSSLEGLSNGVQTRADGITADRLDVIQATACIPRIHPSGRTESEGFARTRGLMDIALVSVMRDAMLRVSEAGRLTWDDIRTAADGAGLVTVRGTGLYLGVAAMRALMALRQHRAGLRNRVSPCRLRRSASVSSRRPRLRSCTTGMVSRGITPASRPASAWSRTWRQPASLCRPGSPGPMPPDSWWPATTGPAPPGGGRSRRRKPGSDVLGGC